MKVKIAIVMGSDSDLPIMLEAAKILDDFGVRYSMIITSAHRSPRRTVNYIKQAQKKGVEVIIAGAGGAAHLAGVIASQVTIPVIGVPIDSRLHGLDSLLSTVQMPKGIPVATMAIGKTGAQNAALLSLQILALKDSHLKRKLKSYKRSLSLSVLKKDQTLQKKRFFHGLKS